MAAARASRRSFRSLWTFLLPQLVAALVACKSSSDAPAHPPALSNLLLSPPSAALGDGGGSVSVFFSVDIADAGADVNRITVTVLGAGGAQVGGFTEGLTNPPGMTEGTLGAPVTIPTVSLGELSVRVQVFDAGGAASNVTQATFTVTEGNPLPVVSSLSPSSAPAGGPSFGLTVTGSGFLPTSIVSWNSVFLTTAYVDASTLVAQVPSYDLGYPGTVSVAVWNAPPGGGSSAPVTFTIEAPPPSPVPTLTSLSPDTVDAGTQEATVTLTGSGFVPSSMATWNGSYLSSTYVDATTLRVSLPSYYLSNVGTNQVRVVNSPPGGGTSSPVTFTVARPVLPGVTTVSLQASDVVWDPYEQKLYVAVPSTSPKNPNSVTTVDPFTGQIAGSRFAGSEPSRLALSDDGRFLYVGLGGASSVARFVLPALASDIEIALGRDPTYGPYYAHDLAVAPGSPHALAVSLQVRGASWNNRLSVFDDEVERAGRLQGTYATYDSLQWGSDASTLYASSGQYSGELLVLSVNASGVGVQNDWKGVFSGYATGLHFDPGTGLVYTDDGHVVNPATGDTEGTFLLSGSYSTALVPDSSLGSAFALSGGGYSWPELRAYHLTEFYQTRSRTFPYVTGPASRLVRWGPDGLAFVTPTELVLVRGPMVLPVSTTANPAPEGTSLAPASAAAGAGNLRIAVTGAGFVPGSIVRWNGADRSTRLVSPTQLVAFIPGSDLATAGTAQVTVSSPAPGGGTSGPLTFTVGP